MFKFIFLIIPFILFASKPELMFPKNYKNQDITGWVMSEKLDGIRAFWNGKNLISRSGNIIHAPLWFTKDYPSFSIDGELWSKRADFENISSIIRDKIPSKQWNQITHNIFEVPNSKGNLKQRLEKVKPYTNNIIKLIPQIKIKSKKHLKEFLANIEKEKGEGVVVRDPLALYIAKRTSKVLKVKTFKDTECEVIAYTEGKGKFKGLVGALKCKLSNGIEFKIGSGFNLEERKNPPKIGDIITFKYKEFTKYNKPRFPVYLRIRYKN